jgi:hypothetical protein
MMFINTAQMTKGSRNLKSVALKTAEISLIQIPTPTTAVGNWAKSQNRDSQVFSSPPCNFWSIEYNHALYWKFGMTGLRSRPHSQMTMDPVKKTFLELRHFERALTCSILMEETQIMLRKAYFLRRGSWLRLESWTPRPRIRNFWPYYWDPHTNGVTF